MKEIDYPYSKYSWVLLTKDTAVKALDKSSFLHHGTAIPIEIRDFFSVSNLGVRESLKTFLVYDSKKYEAHIEMDELDSPRTRLFWRSDFSELLKSTFPDTHAAYMNDDEHTGAPKMKFTRIDYVSEAEEYDIGGYSIELSDDEPNSSNGNRWIFPSNNDAYKVIEAFEQLKVIDWRKRVNLSVGDTVYIYCTKPYQRIMFVTSVVKVNIPYSETIDDKAFWTSEYRADNKKYTFARLKLVRKIDTELLSLTNLLVNGLSSAPRSALRVNDSLRAYIDSVLDNALDDELTLPEELDDTESITYPEGAKKKITINAYERNPAARSECIRIHGSKCSICGFDFGSYYGEAFNGKIHVHHTKPLHEIDSTYEVDPRNDLIPVCPNCHMVIHSKPNSVYSIEDVKQMLSRKLNS